jgi:hypothetical protein
MSLKIKRQLIDRNILLNHHGLLIRSGAVVAARRVFVPYAALELER